MVTPFRNNIPTRVHERIVFNSPLSLPFAPMYSDIDKFVRVIFRRIDGIIRWISGWIVIDSMWWSKLLANCYVLYTSYNRG